MDRFLQMAALVPHTGGGMSKKRYVVRLSKSEREDLSSRIKRGKHKVSALKRRHARVLLKVDQGKHGPSWSDVRTGEALEISTARPSTEAG